MFHNIISTNLKIIKLHKIEILFYEYIKITSNQIKKQSKMSEPIECPICMDCIGEKNCITTECGHKFHAKCMFTNIDHNGFNCPCCRSQLIDEVNDDDEIEDDYDDDDNDDDDSIEANEPFSEDALRGLRLLTNLLEGEEQDQADVVAEFQYNEENDTMNPVPREEVERRFREDGVTYSQLVAWFLVDHEEYESQQNELEEFSGNLWFKMRRIIADYNLADNYEEIAQEAVVEQPQQEAGDCDYNLIFAEGGGFFLEERDIAEEDLELLRADLYQLFEMEMNQQICV